MTLVVLTRPQLLAGGGSTGSPWIAGLHKGGLWIVWLVFLLAYNLPALVLFLAAALGWGLPPLRRVLAAER